MRVGYSGRRFGVEESAEAGPSELDAYEILARTSLSSTDMDDFALCGEIRFLAFARWLRERNMDLEIGADGNVKAGHKGGAAAAEIFAGSFFDKADAAGITSAHGQRQPNGNAALGPRPLGSRIRLNHANPQVLAVPQRFNRSAGDEARGAFESLSFQ